MTRHGTQERRILEEVAERRMRRWTLEGEIARRLAEGRAISPDDAERLLDEIDAGRVEFVRRTFGKDARDPHLYHLVVNLARVSHRDAADLIADLHRRRQAGQG